MRRYAILMVVALPAATGGCEGSGIPGTWAGTVDTLASGRVVVQNPEGGIWGGEGRRWRVEERVRIGSTEAEGAELIGSVTAIEVDSAGRIWVLEGQAQELRVFGPDGTHVRTIGRKGGGPAEFNQAIGMAWGPDGHLWVVDPSNNRISVIDTAGTFVESHPAIGGFVIVPWPGGFDDHGSFYTYAPDRTSAELRTSLVKYDRQLEPVDTLRPPRYEGPQSFFELQVNGRRMRTGVPFSPGLQWRLARDGNIWFALTGEYRIFEIDQRGDTLREISRAFEPLPITDADVDSAIAGLDWFVSQGGKVDRSKIPSTKPALEGFYLDSDGTIWVRPITRAWQQRGAVLDVFDPDGRYLGRVELPFRLDAYPTPRFRDDMIYGVTRDELGVPHVVAAEVVKPQP